ncbi:ABC transporter ATP-binding protein [Phaeacidiphilus oryzae]|uniref:ABC transporter ATP-binding protein n=1 Tax=Phaeacidiphilus oryzae TaxID=348818 RepID=UPI0005616B38|nr:ATP-binding cassette domain-containing protein [Phaeacidiphilus oryzae]
MIDIPGLALETEALGKRYRSTWALRDCTLALPEGKVIALVGPNGAGKTTLLHLAVGLVTATTGRITVQGGLAAGGPEALAAVGFVPQDAALYPNLSVADTIHLARNLNSGFDAARARARVAELDLPLSRKVGRLSGGQRAQIALTLALAKRPRLLILDEPLSSLDPLARHEFTAALMAAVAEDGITVLYSSHVVSELERVCDHLVVLNGGRVQIADDVEVLLATHAVYSGPAELADGVGSVLTVVRERRAGSQAHLLVRTDDAAAGLGAGPAAGLAAGPVAGPAGLSAGELPAWPPPGWQAHPVGLEELILSYLRQPAASALPGAAEPSASGRSVSA